MKITHRHRLAFAAAIATSYTGVAHAVRAIMIDAPPLYDTAPCSLGSACSGFGLSDHTYNGIPQGSSFTTAYMYQEGIVSFDAPLPLTASLAAGPASFGTGNWFAVGASDTQYQTRVQYTTAFIDSQLQTGVLFNFYDPSVSIDDTTANVLPVLQVQLLPTADDFASTRVGYGYGANPQPGALIAFSLWGKSDAVNDTNGLLLGGNTGSNDGYSDLSVAFNGSAPDPSQVTENWLFSPGRPSSVTVSAVPEPAMWLSMIVGFGLIGAGARRQRRVALA